MKRIVPSKTSLALECGVSRQTIYAALRIHGAPKPRNDGTYSVAEMRKFLNRIRRDVPNVEKDKLQATLLALKIRRAERELVDFEEQLRDEISGELRAHFVSSVNLLASRLKMLPRDLATRADGLGAREIFKLSTELLYAAFDKARQDFLSRVPGKPEQSTNVLPFKTRVEANRAELVSQG